jgi:hypothetical protein
MTPWGALRRQIIWKTTPETLLYNCLLDREAYEDSWQEGFHTVENILIKNLSTDGPEWMVVTAHVLADGNYRIRKDQDENDATWQFKDNEVVCCEEGYAVELAKK